MNVYLILLFLYIVRSAMERKFLPEQEMLPRLMMARVYDTRLISVTIPTPERVTGSFEVSLYHTNGCILYLNGLRHDVNQGDLRFNRPGDVVSSGSDFCSSTLYFQLGGEDAAYYNEFLDSIPGFVPGCGGFSHLFEQIIGYFNSEMPGSKTAQNALVLELLHGIYTQSCTEASHSEAVTRCIRYMEEHLSEKITLEDLGRLTGYSSLHAARLFYSEMNRSPHAFLSSLRMERARLLLSETDIPISRLAAECGFASESYFYTHFRAANGMTPGEYRRAALIF